MSFLEYYYNNIIKYDLINRYNYKNIKADKSCITYEYYENHSSYEISMREKRAKNVYSSSQLDSKEKIIKILELEYEDLERQQSALIYSNEEMFNPGAEDLELIECRAENMKFIEKNIKRMKEVRKQILELSKDHIIKNKDIFDIYAFEKTNNYDDTKIESVENNREIVKLINNKEKREVEINYKIEKVENEENLIDEIEL
jgi:hypothetical protein